MKRLAQLGMAVMIALPLGSSGPAWTRTAAAVAGSAVQGSPLRAPASAPLAPANFYTETFVTGLTQPVFVTHAGDGSGRLFIVEQTGGIRIVNNGELLGTPFLQLPAQDLRTGGERGLLALAFHPSYETNGFFYVMYTAPRPGDNPGSILTLKRFTVSGNPDVADYASGLVLLTIDHPFESNHNGGALAFGPDGYLYWSTGDGGGGGDPYENGQDLTELLGKILRLDVDATYPYVPADNPFYSDGTTVDQLIWAYGLRNPWRMAFDRLTGDLYIGDVGQGSWEEIDFQAASSTGGENYGWDQYEGNAVYEGPSSPVDKVFPVAVYAHSVGCSVTGGHVYRGSNFPSLQGHYFFGDYCSGRIWALHYDAGVPEWVMDQMADTTYNISSFGEDEAGQLYLTDLGQSRILRVGYKDPLAFEGVQVSPADGSSVCTTPEITTGLRLSDATRTGGGSFDISKVKLSLDNVDVTAAARVRVSQTHPSSQATLEYTPPSPLTLGAHMATLTYEAADGPVTAAWAFTVTSGTCLTSAQQLSAPANASAEVAPDAEVEVTASPTMAADGEAAGTLPPATEEEAASPPAPSINTPATPLPPATAAPPGPTAAQSTRLIVPGCLSPGAACPGMIYLKK